MRSFSLSAPLKMIPAAIVLTFTLGACAAIGQPGPMGAEDDPCDDLQGTIQVADDAPNMNEMARVTEAEARDAALAEFPGANVMNQDLEEENGFLVYELDLTTGNEEHEVYVDAGSGEVLCSERED